MSRKQIIATIRACARKLGRAPTRAELEQSGVSRDQVQRRLGGLGKALRAAGLEPRGSGYTISTADLLLDWAKVTRKLGRLPPRERYEEAGRYTITPFVRRYRSWLAVPAAFKELAKQEGIEAQWKDVLEMVKAAPEGRAIDQRGWPGEKPDGAAPTGAGRPWRSVGGMGRSSGARGGSRSNRQKCFRDRPLAGPPLLIEGLGHEPMNELCVVFLFGMLAHRMGFRVLSFQQGFPDCEAMREVRPGCWQRARIEIEHESRNFYRHRHNPEGCDLIICWRHNWKECPRDLEVIELRRFVS